MFSSTGRAGAGAHAFDGANDFCGTAVGLNGYMPVDRKPLIALAIVAAFPYACLNKPEICIF